MTANGYTGNTGGGSGAWDDITGKPATFPPSAHTHTTSEITDLEVFTGAPAARIYKNGDTVLENTTETDIDLGVVNYNRDATVYDTTSTPNAIVVLRTGMHLAQVEMNFEGGDEGYRGTLLKVNGTIVREASDEGTYARPAITAPLPLTEGDVLTVATYTNGGTGPTVRGTFSKDVGLTLAWLGDDMALGEGGEVTIADVTGLQAALDLKAPLASPTFTGTVAGVTKSMVGLGSVDNTADTAKPVSTAQQTALDLKAPLASPTFTGTPAAPTATPGTNTTQLASTAFVTAAVAAGGGGGTAPTFTRAYLSAGDKTPGATGSWTPITGMTLVIAATAGDDITLSINGLLNQTATDFFEMVVLVGGSIVRYSSTGTGTPSTANEGDPSLYPMSGVTIKATTAQWSFTTDSGDISGGNVTMALAFKGSGSGKVFASTNYPFRWSVRNDH